jgi:hypothetical protein
MLAKNFHQSHTWMLIMGGPLVALESCRVFEQIIAFDFAT